MVSADLEEGRGIRLESSNLLYSYRQMIKISLELLQANKIIPRTPPPPTPKEISRPKHRWIVIKKSIQNEFCRAYFKWNIVFLFRQDLQEELTTKAYSKHLFKIFKSQNTFIVNKMRLKIFNKGKVCTFPCELMPDQ